MRPHHEDIKPPESLNEWLVQHGEPEPEKLARDVMYIIDARQAAFREANAFPTHTPYSYTQQQDIIRNLPAVDEEGALPVRLNAVTELGMMSLDLMRADLHGNWQGSVPMDERAQRFFTELKRNTRLQSAVGGFAVSGYISKLDPEARAHSSVSSLGSQTDKHGILHVTRNRTVAKLETELERSITVNKRSDFLLSINGDRPEGLTIAARALAHAEYIGELGLRDGMSEEQVEKLFSQTRTGFHTIMEHAILRRPDRLYPITANYYAKVDSDK